MADVVIRAEQLGKRYVIGHQVQSPHDIALRDVLVHGLRGFARKARDLAQGRAVVAGDELEEFWALRDVDFEVRRGEVLGVIGRNGAGKSTLLKILSRITEPTLGRVEIEGRVASLLEVGTGFHGELTGRENIFLNGAILGMTRAEVQRKFDEIVAFSGVEKFLDTPVKRYSSGMYMRLAFAVAAHLESEILLVDEVLAVGDAEFQQKCLGKMKDVASGQGRTVLFVSHNLGAMRALTTRSVLLANGQIECEGDTPYVIQQYVAANANRDPAKLPGKGEHSRILSITLNGLPHITYEPGEELTFRVAFETDGAPGMSLELLMFDPDRRPLGIWSLHQLHGEALPTQPGRFEQEIRLAGLWLAAGRYSFDVTTSVANVGWDHYVGHAVDLDVPYSSPGGRGWDFRADAGLGIMTLATGGPPVRKALEQP